ncbi:MAG: biopolymer transporter ExbD [Pseudomonadota bacterium]
MTALIPRRRKRAEREPTIALINIVFLLLVFFLIAGSLAPPLDDRLTLVDTATLDGRSPPDAAVVLADGTLLYNGAPTTPRDIVALDTSPRIVPDRELPAADLVALARALRAAGAEEVWIVTERALQ